MRDREYSAFMLLNAPGFGTRSIFYIYNNLKRLGLKVNDLFEQNLSQLSSYFPEIGRGKFSRADLSTFQSLDNNAVYSSYQKLKDQNVHIIGLDDERYPKRVIEKLGEDAPPVLFCKGYLPLLNAESISIVGSRDVNDLALTLTRRIANRLADSGYNVTSGFAKGVDTNAHVGALANKGTTTMVLSYGFNHLSIRKDIKEYNWEKNALFISQFMPYEKFSGQNAMIRNKLVCALSKAVIVISSGPERDINGKMSGTYDAGLTALRYKVPLFVLTPSLLDPAPKGNIDLINIGGIPLSSGGELVEYLNRLVGSRPSDISEPTFETVQEIQIVEEPQTIYLSTKDDLKEKVLDVLRNSSLSLKEIIEQVGLKKWTPQKVTLYLKKMDEVEVVKKGRNNLYRRKGASIQPKLFD